MFTRILALIITSSACAGAFLLSFYALSDLASNYGVPAGHAWVWALVVDLSILGGTTARLKMRESNFARMIFICATAVSVAGNTIHALPYGPVGVGIAIFPPIAVLGLFEVCVKLLQNAKTPSTLSPAPSDNTPGPQTSAPSSAPSNRAVVVESAPIMSVADTSAPALTIPRTGAAPDVQPAPAAPEPPVWLQGGSQPNPLTESWRDRNPPRQARKPRTEEAAERIPENV